MPLSYEFKVTDLGHFYDLWKKGHVTFYKRAKAWPNWMKAGVIAGVLQDHPMGSVVVNVLPALDKDGTPIETYDIVGARQRMTSLFEYRDDQEDWVRKAAKKGEKKGFTRYGELSEAQKERFDSYGLGITYLRDCGDDDIRKIYASTSEQMPLTKEIRDKIMYRRARSSPLSRP